MRSELRQLLSQLRARGQSQPPPHAQDMMDRCVSCSFPLAFSGHDGCGRDRRLDRLIEQQAALEEREGKVRALGRRLQELDATVIPALEPKR
jgi:hypothetical protein